MLVICPPSIVETTLAHLRLAGERNCECVVLWLGRRTPELIAIEAAYLPIQAAKEDMFHIPPEGMHALHTELRKRRYMVAAQVHSHPHQAFHSKADDRWAIVRHEGALSLVVPDFAVDTTVPNFFDRAKVFNLSPFAHWVEVPPQELSSWLRIS